jgi:hypothetical protein
MTRDADREGPGIDTEALRRVSEADLAPPGRRRPSKKSAPWPLAAGLGLVCVAAVGFVIARRGGDRAPEVESLAPAADPALGVGTTPSASERPSASPRGDDVEVAPLAIDAPPSERPTSPGRDDPARAPARSLAARSGEGEALAPGRAARERDVEAALARLKQRTGVELLEAGGLEAARTTLDAECQAGDARACATLGKKLFEQGKSAADVAAATAALERACAGKVRDVCTTLAARLAAEPTTRGHAEELYAKACELASGPACRAGAELVAARDPSSPRVLALHARACALGEAESCRRQKQLTETSTR